jgi:hypothetical protein
MDLATNREGKMKVVIYKSVYTEKVYFTKKNRKGKGDFISFFDTSINFSIKTSNFDDLFYWINYIRTAKFLKPYKRKFQLTIEREK